MSIEELAWQRVLLVGPSIVLYAALAGALFACSKIAGKKLETLVETTMGAEWLDEAVKSPLETTREVEEIHKKYPKINRLSLASGILFYSFTIMKEELIFRAPLVVLFTSMTTSAFTGVVVSTALFSLMHVRASLGFLVQFLHSPTLKFKIKNRDRIIAGMATAILGWICGYCAIRSQSLWVPTVIHIAWNLVVPTLLMLIMLFAEIASYMKRGYESKRSMGVGRLEAWRNSMPRLRFKRNTL